VGDESSGSRVLTARKSDVRFEHCNQMEIIAAEVAAATDVKVSMESGMRWAKRYAREA